MVDAFFPKRECQYTIHMHTHANSNRPQLRLLYLIRFVDTDTIRAMRCIYMYIRYERDIWRLRCMEI